MAGTDFSHLTSDELIKGIKALDLPDYIRSKAYGIDVRETLAQMTEMTIQLGVNMGLSPDDALRWARKLQESVSQSEFDSWVATLLDGGPSIFMNTLSELQSTYPNGASGVALVRETDPAKIYVWNGTAWEDFGDYQGIEVKDKTVTTPKLADLAVTNQKLDTDIKDALKYYDFTLTDGKFVSKTGAIGNGQTYAHTSLIYLPAGEIVEVKAGGSASVSVISKYDSSGTFLSNLQSGEDKLGTYTIRSTGDGMWVRITNNTLYLPHGKVYVKSLDMIDNSSIDKTKLTSDLQKEIGYIPSELVYGEFITSSSHAQGVGKVGIGPTYIRTKPIPLKAGESIEFNAVSSASTLSLSIVDASGNFENVGIVGSENSEPLKYFKASEDCYVIITNNTASVPEEDFYVKKKNDDKLEITPQLLKKPVINFQFDDGNSTDSEIKSIFDEFGLKCGFAIPTSATGIAKYYAWQQEGFEVLSHSINGETMTNAMDSAEAERRMKESKETLESLGLDITGWVTPSSSLGSNHLQGVGKYYEYAYTVSLGTYTNDMAQEPYDDFSTDTRRLKRVSLESTTYDNVIAAIDKTILDGGLLTFYAHDFSRGLTNEILNNVLNYVKTKIDGGECLVLKPTDAYKHFYSIRHSDIEIGENVVGTENIKDSAVVPDKTSFFEKGKNKVDNTKFTNGYYVNPNNGALAKNASHMTSDYTALKPNTKYAANYHGRLAFYANRNVESFVSGLDFSSTAPPITFTTPANANYARYSINSTTALETFQIEEGETSTPYERFYEKIPQGLLSLPETADYAESYLVKGGTDDVPSAPFIGALDNGTRVDLNPIEDDGILRKIEFRSSKSGSVKVKFLSLADNMLTLENEVSLTANAGYNIYEANIDFKPFNVEKGWLVGYYSSPDDAKLPFIAGTGIGSYNIAGVDVTGTVSATTTASYNIAISVTVEQTIEQLASKIDKLSVGGASASTEPSRLLLSETFKESGTPPQFTNSGFTLGNGASFSGTGGISNQLVWTKDSTLNTSKTRVWFTPTNTTPDLAIVRKHPISNSLGGIFRLEGANKKLIMYAPWTQNTTSLPAIAKEATLTVPIVANRQYLLELERQTIGKHNLRITDTITGESQEILNDYVDTRLFSIGSGHVGVVAFGGSFTINKIQYASNEPTKPRIAFYGDSFVEAATLILDGGVQLRYADLVKTKLGGSAHINGRGGDKSDTLVNKLSTDFTTERADYVVLAIGTNDTVFDTWLSNITTLIEAVEAKGSIPILMTLTKITSSDRTAFMTAVNNWILNSGYLYVDANLATTLNNDRQTQNTSLFKADGVHPNVEGHGVIYRRFLLDVPEVFDGY